MKVIYNNCYGGFGLSEIGLKLYNEKRRRSNLSPITFGNKIVRDDPLLVEVVEELGIEASGDFAKLEVMIIDDVYSRYYEINGYDGKETVICKTEKLVKQILREVKLDNLTDEQCRSVLKNMIELVE